MSARNFLFSLLPVLITTSVFLIGTLVWVFKFRRQSASLEPWIRGYAEWIVRRRKPAIAVMGVIVAVSAAGLLRLELIADWRIFCPKGSGIAETYIDAVNTFGTDERAVLVLRDPIHGALSNEALTTIAEITDELWRVEGVKRVDSLINYPSIRASSVGFESGALAWSTRSVAAAGSDGQILVWNRSAWGEAPKRLVGHEGLVDELLFGADGRLYSGAVDGTVRIWDLETSAPPKILTGAPAQISALLLSRDGRRIYAGSHGAVHAWDTNTGALAFQTSVGADYITALAFDPAGRVIAASREITAIDPVDGKVVATAIGHRGFVTALLGSEGPGPLYSAGADGRVIAWSAGDLAPTELFSDASIAVLTLARDPSGRSASLLFGSSDGTIRQIAPDGEIEDVVRAHDDWVVDLAVGESGVVYSASRDHDVVVQERTTGSRSSKLRAHRAAVRRVAIDGGQIFSLGDDGDLFVWDAKTLEIVVRLHRAASEISEATPPAAQQDGRTPKGRLRVQNEFRVPLDVFADGQRLGRVGGLDRAELGGILVGEAKDCSADSECRSSEYCDLEAETPYCSRRVSVEARPPGSALAMWSGSANLGADQIGDVHVPGSSEFSVTTIEPPLRAEARSQTYGRTFSPLRIPIQPFRLREYAYHLLRSPDPPARGVIINDAEDTTLIAVQLDLADESVPRMTRVMAIGKIIGGFVERARAKGFESHGTGEMLREAALFEYSIRDRNNLFPVSLCVIALLLFVVYRRISAVVIPLSVVLSAIVVSMGVSGWLGIKLNVITVNVGQIVVVVCVGEAVHVFNTYSRYVIRGATPRRATIESLVENLIPCFWTNFTTAVGFFALSWTGIEVIDSFGQIAGLSVLMAFVAGFVLMPGIIASLPSKGGSDTAPLAEEEAAHGKFEERLAAIANWVNRSGGALIGFGVLVLVVSIIGLARVTVDSNPLLYFAKTAPVRVGSEFIEKHISGPAGLRLLVDTKEPGGVRRVAHLQAVEKITDHLLKDPAVRAVSSLSNIERAMNRAMNQDLPYYYKVPSQDSVASTYYNAYSLSLRHGMELTNRVSDDESRTAIDLQLVARTSEENLRWAHELSSWIDANIGGVAVTITGGNWIDSNVGSTVTSSFFWNLGSALLEISLLMMMVARSFRIGSAAAVANIAPMALVVGSLGVAGQELDIAVLMATCVAIGIVVDDTIHFITHYRRLRLKGKTHEEATLHTTVTSGRALVVTTLLLSAGIAMYMLTDFGINQRFGLVTVLILLAGLPCDLMLLPPILKLIWPAARPRGD